ncbi:MAG: InlB B-repeat-containing protein, partial [Lachnospiraceae bacterium]|nr:InlB B-repeat-containing protein [Lachnospiraceae bacterium]
MNKTMKYLGKFMYGKSRFAMKLLTMVLIAGMLAGSVSTTALADELTDVVVAAAEETNAIVETEEAVDATVETEETIDITVETEETTDTTVETEEATDTTAATEEEVTDTTAATEEEVADTTVKTEGTADTVVTEEIVPENGAVVYATPDEFTAACSAMGDADDIESTLAVLDNIEAVYAKLSEEDKATVTDYWAYIQEYAAMVRGGNPDEGINTTALNTGHSVNVRFVVLILDSSLNTGYTFDNSKSTTFICQYSTPHSDTAYNNHTIAISDIRAAANSLSIKSGYEVAGWTKSANANPTIYSLSLSGTTACNKGDTIYIVAKASSKTFTLNYNANGGSGAPSTQTATGTGSSYSFKVSNTQPTRTGYEFLGWSTSSTATTPSYYGGSTISVSSSTTLYAVWKQKTNTFTLNYDANGGSGAPSTQTATSTGSSHNFTVSYTTPSRSGYDFLGWSTSSTATTPSYYGGDSINVTGTTTLYAVWKEKAKEKVVLTYMDRGIQYDQVTCDKGTTVTIVDCTNTRDGYDFKGWSASSEAKDAEYEVGDGFTLNANAILYAVWEKRTPPMPSDNGEGVSIEKTRTSAATAKVGDIITWNITVTNNSNVEKTVTLTEKDGVSLSKNSVTLAAGASETVTASYVVTGNETLDADGKFYNTVKGTTGGNGEPENPEVTDNGTEITVNKEQVTITVNFVDENDNIVGTETVEVNKDDSYDVTEETKKIPEGYEANGDPTGDPVTGTATENKTVIVPVKTAENSGNGDEETENVTVTITVNFVDENGNIVGTETKEVEKDAEYDVTEETKKIPEGYESNGEPTGDPVTGKADSNKTVVVPVKTTENGGNDDEETDKVTITVNFVDENGNIVGTETKEVEKDAEYDVTEEAEKIPEGYEADSSRTADPTTGTADEDKIVNVPVKTTSTEPTPTPGPGEGEDPTPEEPTPGPGETEEPTPDDPASEDPTPEDPTPVVPAPVPAVVPVVPVIIPVEPTVIPPAEQEEDTAEGEEPE